MALAFLVEGRMEQRIVQRLCSGAPVRLIGVNGKDATPEAIAKRAAPLIRLLKNHYPIVIVFDREARKLSCSAIETEFRKALKANQVERDDLIIGIADQMIENWILGCAKVRERFGLSGSYEGKDGKAILSRVLEQSGSSYHETTVGVDLFCEMDVSTVRKHSNSFARFASKLEQHCSWIRRGNACSERGNDGKLWLQQVRKRTGQQRGQGVRRTNS
jgi:hypothetical protein